MCHKRSAQTFFPAAPFDCARFAVGLIFIIVFGIHPVGGQSTCGPPRFACSRHDLEISQPDASPKLDFGGLHGAGRVVRDPVYNNVEVIRCTDAFSNPVHPNASFEVGLGGAGDKNSWSLDDRFVHITETNGVPLIFHFDRVAKRCRPVCTEKSEEERCSGRGLYVSGPGVFSKLYAGRYFSFPSSAAPGTAIKAVDLNSGNPAAPFVVADFAPALYKGTNPDWQPKMKVELGDVIQPHRNNDAGFELFQAVSAGTTGEHEPSWTNAVEPYRSRNHTSLPLPKWPGAQKAVASETKVQPGLARNQGKFIFKVTTAGVLGLEQPEWCQTPGCTVGDGTAVWTNMSATTTISDGTVTWMKVGRTGTETWVGIAGVENKDRVFAVAISYSYPESAQDTGVWAIVYDSAASRFYQLNTYTKVQTDFACVGGEGYACKGGMWKRMPSRLVPSSDSITVHAVSLSLDGKTLDIVCGGWAGPCRQGINKLWHYETATWDEVAKDGDGHSVLGYTHFVNEGAGAGSDAPTQKYLSIRPQTQAELVSPLWRFSPCVDVSTVMLPYAHPPCYPQFDQHLSWIFNLGRDEEPVIGTTYVNGNGYPASSPWQYELIGIAACGRANEPACPKDYERDRIWRFGRTFNFNFKSSGSNFYALGSIGALSQTGRYYALTSMGLGTMGSTRGSENCTQGFSWARVYTYRNGQLITPYTENPGNFTFEARCEGSCVSGKTEPRWPQDESSSVSDNQITWVGRGVANCRSDVLIYKLQ